MSFLYHISSAHTTLSAAGSGYRRWLDGWISSTESNSISVQPNVSFILRFVSKGSFPRVIKQGASPPPVLNTKRFPRLSLLISMNRYFYSHIILAGGSVSLQNDCYREIMINLHISNCVMSSENTLANQSILKHLVECSH